MVAGAGSGKTTSLVKALTHLGQTRRAELKARGQRVACITYTEVAVKEIWGDVGNDPLFHVSTIHSFLWTVVRPFQVNLKAWVIVRIHEKIAEAQEHHDRPRTRPATRERLTEDIARYRRHLEAVERRIHFTYGAGSHFASQDRGGSLVRTRGHIGRSRSGRCPGLRTSYPAGRLLRSRPHQDIGLGRHQQRTLSRVLDTAIVPVEG